MTEASTAKIAPLPLPDAHDRLVAALREAAQWAPHVGPDIAQAVTKTLASAERRRNERRFG